MNNHIQNISWVDAPWLKEHLEEVSILDVQPDIHDYILEHIPGAVYFNENHLRAFHHNLLPITFQINVFSNSFNQLAYRKTKPLWSIAVMADSQNKEMAWSNPW